jgi:hypothetical protein
MSKDRLAVISIGHGEDDDAAGPADVAAQPRGCADTNCAGAAKLTITIKE